MNVSRQFLRDFAEIANRYGWTAADIDEAKAEVRTGGAPMVEYLSTLAAAHRAGYVQTRENGYIRLHAWCQQQGCHMHRTTSSQEWIDVVRALSALPAPAASKDHGRAA